MDDQILGALAHAIAPEDMKRLAQVLLGFSDTEIQNATWSECQYPFKTNYEMLNTWRNLKHKEGKNRIRDLMDALILAKERGYETTRAIEKLHESKIAYLLLLIPLLLYLFKISQV